MPIAITDSDLREAENAMQTLRYSTEELRQQIAYVIAVERERCAQIAENMGTRNGRILASHKHVAAQIRSGHSRIVKRDFCKKNAAA